LSYDAWRQSREQEQKQPRKQPREWPKPSGLPSVPVDPNWQISRLPSRFDWNPRDGLVEYQGREKRKVPVDEMERPEVQDFIRKELIRRGRNELGGPHEPQWSNESSQLFGVSKRCAPKRFAPGKGWTAVPGRFKNDPVLDGLIRDCGGAPRGRAKKACYKAWGGQPACCLKHMLSTLSHAEQMRFLKDEDFRAQVYNRRPFQAQFGNCLANSLRTSVSFGESGDYVNFLSEAEPSALRRGLDRLARARGHKPGYYKPYDNYDELTDMSENEL
jgi:hypothetical protein